MNKLLSKKTKRKKNKYECNINKSTESTIYLTGYKTV